MLILIDQSRGPTLLRYRCTNCLAEGISNYSRGPDGFFLEADLDPPRWTEHVCASKAEAPAKKPKRSA